MFRTAVLSLLVLGAAARIDQQKLQAPQDGGWRLLRFSPTHTEWVPDAMVAASSVQDCTFPAPGVSPMARDALCSAFSRPRFSPGFIDITAEVVESGFTAEPIEGLVLDAFVQPSFDALPYKAPNATKYEYVQDWVVNATQLEETVRGLSVGFKTRYYKSGDARASGDWLKERMEKFVSLHPRAGKVVEIVNAGFNQPNLVATIPGTDPSLPRLILGAHYDSVAGMSRFFPSTPAPGADDDATGIATLLGAMSLLAEHNYTGARTVEFHAYSAEEGGLLGSGTVARKYKADGVDVYGMLQLEMNGYQQSTTKTYTSTITILSDPQPDFAKYTYAIAQQYAPTANVVMSECEYGCSDHYSFHTAGYRAGTFAEAGPADKNLNPSIHTSGDNISKINFLAMKDCVQVAVGFVVELCSKA